MLKPDDLLSIAIELKVNHSDGLANEIMWLASYPKTIRSSFKKIFPDCYKALTVPLKNVPKYLSQYPIIARYRLKHGR
jgi:hypothetical protein